MNTLSDSVTWPVLCQSVSSRLTSRFWCIVILAMVGSLWFLTANLSLSINSEFEVLPEPPIQIEVPRKRVVLRTTPTNSGGMGSVIAQLRSSAAIATMLEASFATFSVPSGHPLYRAASIMQLDLIETPMGADTRVCSVTASPHHARTLELMKSWCDEPTLADENALELRGLYTDCDLILDDRPWDVRYDMSKCTWKWVKHVFSRFDHKKREGGIGLHIRWGDYSNNTYSYDPLTPERSTPIDKAAQLLRKLRECGMQDELSVYMEYHNATMLRGLGEPYRIVDSDNDVHDLIDLASNRLMILDVSGYTVLAHQIAEGNVTIVPDKDNGGITWHDNGVNHVLRWSELLSIACSDLSALFST